MQSKFKFMEGLVWLTQVGLSVFCPLLVFIFLAVWLKTTFHLGGWVLAVGIVLGLFSAGGSLVSTFKLLNRSAKDQKDKDKTIGFNDHN